MIRETLYDENYDEDGEEYQDFRYDYHSRMTEVHGFPNAVYVASGTCGRWNGTFDAGTIFPCRHENAFGHMRESVGNSTHHLQVERVGNDLRTTVSHHDGSDIFVLRLLTGKGVKLWEANGRGKSRELVERLMKSPHSHPVFKKGRSPVAY